MRVLVVRVGAMGDVLHALPAVTALKRARPEWEIGWVVDRRWAPLLSGAVVDRVVPVATRDWGLSAGTVRQIAGLRGELRGAGYDVAVDMQGTIRSAVIGWMAGAEELAGYGDPREGPPAGWMYGRRVERRGMHVIEQGCGLLGDAVGVALKPVEVELPVSGAAEVWCDGLGLERFCVVAPTAGWGAKMWPAERYGAVARELVGMGYEVVVNAAGEGDWTAAVVAEASGGLARVVASTVEQMVALVRRAELVIAGDTGPLHLGAALGRPVVGLFGPTDPGRNGPYGRRVTVLRSDVSVTDHTRRREPESGLLQIGVEDVMVAAKELLRTKDGGRVD